MPHGPGAPGALVAAVGAFQVELGHGSLLLRAVDQRDTRARSGFLEFRCRPQERQGPADDGEPSPGLAVVRVEVGIRRPYPRPRFPMGPWQQERPAGGWL